MVTEERQRSIYNSIFIQILITIGLNILTTLLSFLIEYFGFTEVNVVLFYILSVLVTSRMTKGYVYGIVASVMSILSFNFFFTTPLYTFKVDDSSYIFTFLVMFISAVFTSALTSKLIKSMKLSNERDKQSHLLSKITGTLAKTSEIPETAKVSAELLSGFLSCEVNCFIPDQKCNNAVKIRVDDRDTTRQIYGTVSEETMSSFLRESYTFPVNIRNATVCYFCLPKEIKNLNGDSKFMLYSIFMQITISMERVLLIRDKEKGKSEIALERFKSNLLRAISHDLRTPLTRITGTSEMLMNKMTDEDNVRLAKSINEDAGWLTLLVENILSFTRIHEGNLSIKIQEEAIEEIIAAAVKWANKYYPNHTYKVNFPEELFFVPMNGKLIEQVLINLIGNAAEHTAESDMIVISVWEEEGKAWFEVKDDGIGFDEEDIPKIFEMFFVSSNKRVDSKHGLGLGLAICKAIVEFHGGEIYAMNNEDGGATLKFYLNMRETT